jgi:hypothetical protein
VAHTDQSCGCPHIGWCDAGCPKVPAILRVPYRRVRPELREAVGGAHPFAAQKEWGTLRIAVLASGAYAASERVSHPPTVSEVSGFREQRLSHSGDGGQSGIRHDSRNPESSAMFPESLQVRLILLGKIIVNPLMTSARAAQNSGGACGCE